MKRKNVTIDIQLLATGFISKQLSKLMPRLRGASTAENVEDVHQTRVACRRIRAALHLFGGCFGKKQPNEWDSQLKRLLKSFGKARDLDVQIMFLKNMLDGFGKENASVCEGIERMLLRWQQQRIEVQPEVVKAIKRIHHSNALTNMHLQMEKVRFMHSVSQEPLNNNVVCKYAYDHIQFRIKALMVFLDSLKNPEDVEGHHSMRIATKKLRYAMEIFDSALQGRLTPAIKNVKEVQSLLGEMHDCDVWNADIVRFMKREEEKTREFYGQVAPFGQILPGLLFLQKERTAHRLEIYTKACGFLDQLKREHFWDTCLSVLICKQSGSDIEQITGQADNGGEISEKII